MLMTECTLYHPGGHRQYTQITLYIKLRTGWRVGRLNSSVRASIMIMLVQAVPETLPTGDSS